MSKRLVCITNDYFDSLYREYENRNCKLKPYFNKRMCGTRFTRPYICLDYSKHFETIECFPLSSYKESDNIQAKHFKFIIINKKVKAKIILNCGIVVPRFKTFIINVSKNSLNKCNKNYKERLVDLKNELQFCNKNYRLIKSLLREYKNLNRIAPTKYKLLDRSINLDFNKKLMLIETNKIENNH